MAIDHPHTLIILCDGGYRRLSLTCGVATYAFILCRGDGRQVLQESGVACRGPIGCNFMAEYAAVTAALRWLRSAPLPPAIRIEIWCDCEGIVLRLKGKNQPLGRLGTVMLHRAALRHSMWLRSRGHTVLFRWVPRKRVQAADKLCRQAYTSTAARCPKPLTQFLRHEKPTAIPRRNDLYAKFFTKVGRPPDSEWPATLTK